MWKNLLSLQNGILGKEEHMPGQPKYCPECKGYGQLYQQTITRYGDTRIKEQTRQNAIDCQECKGTGLISLQTTKVPQFKPEDLDLQNVASLSKQILDAEPDAEEPKEEKPLSSNGNMTEESNEIVEKLLESVDDNRVEKSDKDMEFEPKSNEPPDGEMPL